MFYVTGMHSSGTSLFSKFLHYNNVDMFLGSEKPNYLYEHSKFRNLSHKILNEVNYHRYTHDELLFANRLSVRDELREEMKEQIKYTINLASGKNTDWGFKTPINSLCIWRWIELLIFYKLSVNIVLIYRHPSEVIESFKRRKSKRDLEYLDDDKKIEFVWYNYNQSVYKFYMIHKKNPNLNFYFFNIRNIIDQPVRQALGLKGGYDISDVFENDKFHPVYKNYNLSNDTIGLYQTLEELQ